MAAITWVDVVALAAELATFPLAGQTILLEHVNLEFEEGEFGGEDHPRLKTVRILWVAHFATLIARKGTTAGPLISSSAGRLTRTYAQINTSGGGWSATPYGTLLEAIFQGTPSSIGMAT